MPARRPRPAASPAPGDVPPWRYAEPRAPASRAARVAERLLPLALAAAVLSAVAAGLPRLALALAGPTAVLAGGLTPSWTAPAAFVHPGRSLVLPQAGRVGDLAAEGLVAAGAPLAAVSPPPVPADPGTVAGWPRWEGAVPQDAGPALRPVLRAALCLRPACLGGGAPAQQAVLVPAPEAGWFYPGWDPLAGLGAAALGDLPPDAVQQRPLPTPQGVELAAGAVLGELGAPWDGLWAVALPEAAFAALAAPTAAITLAWGGLPAGAVALLGAGPAVGGRFLALLSAAGPGSPPPARATVTVALAPARGELVPLGALRPGARVEQLVDGGARPVAVTVLARGRRRAVVSGLPAGAVVFRRPALLVGRVAGAA